MPRKRPDSSLLIDEKITRQIIGAFFECYNKLGYGFLESVYRRALLLELRSRGLLAVEEQPVEVFYKGIPVGSFRLDLLVEHRIVVEAKATASLSLSDKRQVINYLRATRLELGLLLHFGPEPRFERCLNAELYRAARKREVESTNPALSGRSG
jgi:GxxExxY protein